MILKEPRRSGYKFHLANSQAGENFRHQSRLRVKPKLEFSLLVLHVIRPNLSSLRFNRSDKMKPPAIKVKSIWKAAIMENFSFAPRVNAEFG
jgi:hypothetical protein